MCVPSVRNCFCDLDELNPEIWNLFLKWAFFVREFDRNELPAGHELTLCNTQDPSHYTFCTEYTNFDKKWIFSPYILWVLSPRL